MTDTELVALPQDTISLLKSNQVVTSVWSAVKELVENSLDAGAKNIEVRSVCVDGCRVAREEVARMVQPNTTSKIRDMGDIERLKTRGFRREALSSLCQVAYLTIVFRTEAELAATKTSCAGMPGITVTADNLFCRLPVRRNYYKSANRRKEELDKVKMLVQARRFARKRDRVLSPDRGGLAHLAADHHCPGPAPLSGQGQGRVPDVCCLRGLEQ